MPALTALIADIGGTNTRLALTEDGAGYSALTTYVNRTSGTLEACLDDYLERHGVVPGDVPLLLAVAAPVADDTVRLTNLDWTVSAAALVDRYGFAGVTLLNDFAAVAAAVPAFGTLDVLALGGGAGLADQPVLVVGPGTGFGASLHLPSTAVLPTEGGHALIAPVTDVEAAVLERLRRTHGPISIEQVLSGAGLVRLYEAVAGDVAAAESNPASIAERACRGEDAAAVRTLDLFFAFLGIAVRNLVLATGARGGVYLAGGILPRYPERLAASQFRARFETPAPLPGYLENVPIWLITHGAPALLGLARIAARADRSGGA
ncbi:MAG: glucokinase [Gammaproteobacteria bacterium]